MMKKENKEKNVGFSLSHKAITKFFFDYREALKA